MVVAVDIARVGAAGCFIELLMTMYRTLLVAPGGVTMGTETRAPQKGTESACARACNATHATPSRIKNQGLIRRIQNLDATGTL